MHFSSKSCSPQKHSPPSTIKILNYLGNRSQSLFGVLEGNGTHGELAASFLRDALPVHIEKFYPISLVYDYDSLTPTELVTVQSAIQQAFKAASHDLLANPSINSLYSGATCSLVFIKNSYCFCVGLGNVRVVVGKFRGFRWEGAQLLTDHTVEDASEKSRIVAHGAVVKREKDHRGLKVGPLKVLAPCTVLPGLAVSRCFGNQALTVSGVTSESTVTSIVLGKTDKFIIVASSLVWERLSNTEAIKIVSLYWKTGNVQGAVASLMSAVLNKGPQDNAECISVIVVFLCRN